MLSQQKTKFLGILEPLILEKFGKRTPLEVIHEVTFRCNSKCKYCGISRMKMKEMSTEQVKTAIKEFTDAGTRIWTFTGGEPLLRKDIGELINYAKDSGILFLHLVTNGVLFKKNLNELRRADKIYFSLDGPREVHEKTRCRGTYDKVIESIRLAKAEGFDVTIQTVICEENVKNDFYGIRFLFDLAQQLGVKIIFHPFYLHAHGNIPYKQLSDEKNIRALELIKALKKRSKSIRRSDTVYDEWIRRFQGVDTKLKSYAGILYCHLLPDGRVSPCFFKKETFNGLNEGFLEAFRQLNVPHECNCISFFAEKDFQYSMNFDMMKYFIVNVLLEDLV